MPRLRNRVLPFRPPPRQGRIRGVVDRTPLSYLAVMLRPRQDGGRPEPGARNRHPASNALNVHGSASFNGRRGGCCFDSCGCGEHAGLPN
eukprot:scaffold975_cov398-Prasinococcus_capsulatus_cf.AAC.6